MKSLKKLMNCFNLMGEESKPLKKRHVIKRKGNEHLLPIALVKAKNSRFMYKEIT